MLSGLHHKGRCDERSAIVEPVAGAGPRHPGHGFCGEANRRHQLSLATFRDLHAWTVKHPGLFWDLLWDFGGVIGDKGARLATDLDAMPGAKFFPGAKLNFAENLLRRTDAREALVFRGEDKRTERMTVHQVGQGSLSWRCAMSAGEEHRGTCQSGSAHALPGPAGVADLIQFRFQI
jgi:hypothetical protein